MNERIQELAQQAFINAGYDTKDELFDILFKQGTEFHEKFAELIVKECNRYACSAWEHGPLLGRDLLIHFGIVRLNDEQTY
jgi:hypothetical protein